MQNLLEVLQVAVQFERRGRQAYLDAARRTENPVIQAVLKALADDEEAHERMIRRYYQALERQEGWPDPDTHMPVPQPARQRVEEIISQTVGAAGIGSDPAFLEVYEAAREMELQSRDYYRAQADATEDAQLVKFFRFLAGMEQTHLEMLGMLVEATREAVKDQ